MNIQHTDYEYEYAGYQYRTWKDYEEDNIKTFHECWKDGKPVRLCREFENTSPYGWVQKADFIRYVDQQIVIDFLNGV